MFSRSLISSRILDAGGKEGKVVTGSMILCVVLSLSLISVVSRPSSPSVVSRSSLLQLSGERDAMRANLSPRELNPGTERSLPFLPPSLRHASRVARTSLPLRRVSLVRRREDREETTGRASCVLLHPLSLSLPRYSGANHSRDFCDGKARESTRQPPSSDAQLTQTSVSHSREESCVAAIKLQSFCMIKNKRSLDRQRESRAGDARQPDSEGAHPLSPSSLESAVTLTRRHKHAREEMRKEARDGVASLVTHTHSQEPGSWFSWRRLRVTRARIPGSSSPPLLLIPASASLARSFGRRLARAIQRLFVCLIHSLSCSLCFRRYTRDEG